MPWPFQGNGIKIYENSFYPKVQHVKHCYIRSLYKLTLVLYNFYLSSIIYRFALNNFHLNSMFFHLHCIIFQLHWINLISFILYNFSFKNPKFYFLNLNINGKDRILHAKIINLKHRKFAPAFNLLPVTYFLTHSVEKLSTKNNLLLLFS